MKLFGIKDTQTKRLVPNAFFSSKQQAKQARDQLNRQAANPQAYVVTLGPDHLRFKR